MNAKTPFIGRLGWRGLGVLAAALMLLAAVVIGTTRANAQLSAPDHRFFGFAGDVTIDGEAITVGTVITAIVDGQDAYDSVVSEAGSWFLDVPVADISEPCNVTFAVDGIESDEAWESCPMRVVLELSSDDLMADDDSEDLMEEDEMAEEDEVAEQPAPTVPGTGTGGLLQAESASPWTSAAAITGLLLFALAAVGVMIGRRTDSVR